MAANDILSNPTVPRRGDTRRLLLIKILNALGPGGAIASGGSVFGGVQVNHGAFADPNGNVTPSNPSMAALYYQDGTTNNVWRWDVDTATWINIISP